MSAVHKSEIPSPKSSHSTFRTPNSAFGYYLMRAIGAHKVALKIWGDFCCILRMLMSYASFMCLKLKRAARPGSSFPFISCQLPLVSCRLSAAACQLPLVSCRLSAAACQLPLVSCRLSAAACQLSSSSSSAFSPRLASIIPIVRRRLTAGHRRSSRRWVGRNHRVDRILLCRPCEYYRR